MEFLKTLADFVNQMHWQRGDQTPSERLSPFFGTGPQPYMGLFRDVYSVSFYDSLCVIEKRAAGVVPGLGERVIVGTQASVSADPLDRRSAS